MSEDITDGSYKDLTDEMVTLNSPCNGTFFVTGPGEMPNSPCTDTTDTVTQ